ncbi:hypothetical protein GGI04_000084 [Coemansia thaxteri]|uniref:tRNA(Ile)-lysidine synthetase n=1 Tax=Coemansia thaxteri TaxID=2663907 RepID=A0A9W8BG18_9FUNG|nr:hypothetical protein H4R26_001681 [Coemansia thaxteri]KAJ2009875.1 hypothetical protein GGI04_000084 [Coemansia thaxteri]KAJ2474498.1 hypothetical protein GGI02_000025 [Coemansia sp. RSA 2322]KAJ2485656.1 hypothetical protein EV174_001594 [Coemansia sp. RSA 2320]
MALAYVVSRAVGADKCHAVTIDHGFRPGSSNEAKNVGRTMHQLGISHETRRLEWSADSSDGRAQSMQMPPVQRLEEVARERRYSEIADVCRRQGIGAVLTGHHGGDQAETFLLRLLRQSGVYGLAGMGLQTPLAAAAQEWWHSATPGTGRPVIVRPLLQIKKEELYGICKAQKLWWHEDESNTDARFRRNQLRQLIGAKNRTPKSAFSTDSLLRICGIMQGHREFINQGVERLLASHATFDASAGTVELAAAASGGRALPAWATNAALRERVLAHIVGWVGCKGHPPELAHVQQFSQAVDAFYRRPGVAAAAAAAGGVTAAGVTALPPGSRRGWLFCRQPPRAGEIEALESLALGSAAVWDRRLLISARLQCEAPDSRQPGPAAWSVYCLDYAGRRWHAELSAHRSRLKGARTALPPPAVLASLPVVCVLGADNTHIHPVLALGHAISDVPPAASAVAISVRALGAASAAAAEVVR